PPAQDHGRVGRRGGRGRAGRGVCRDGREGRRGNLLAALGGLGGLGLACRVAGHAGLTRSLLGADAGREQQPADPGADRGPDDQPERGRAPLIPHPSRHPPGGRTLACVGLYAAAMVSSWGVGSERGINVKITAIKNLFMRVARQNWYWVEVETDAGVVGLGEASLEGRELTVAAAVDELSRYLVGQDPGQIEHHWQRLHRHGFWRGGVVLNSAI